MSVINDERMQCPICHNQTLFTAIRYPETSPKWEFDIHRMTYQYVPMNTSADVYVVKCDVCGHIEATSPLIDRAKAERIKRAMNKLNEIFSDKGDDE